MESIDLLVLRTARDWLQAGEQLDQVQIELPETGLLQIGLEVLHVMPVLGAIGHEHYRAGCVFTGMTLAQETMVQRYITHLERERRALLR